MLLFSLRVIDYASRRVIVGFEAVFPELYRRVTQLGLFHVELRPDLSQVLADEEEHSCRDNRIDRRTWVQSAS